MTKGGTLSGDGAPAWRRARRRGDARGPMMLGDAPRSSRRWSRPRASARAGVVHRDLKPENSSWRRPSAERCRHGQNSDFGIAKLVADGLQKTGRSRLVALFIRPATDRKGKIGRQPSVALGLIAFYVSPQELLAEAEMARSRVSCARSASTRSCLPASARKRRASTSTCPPASMRGSRAVSIATSTLATKTPAKRCARSPISCAAPRWIASSC